MQEKLRITSYLKNTEIDMRTKLANEYEILTEDFYQMTATEHKTNPLWKDKKILKIQFNPNSPVWDLDYDSDDLPILKLDAENGIDEYKVQQSKDARDLNRRKRNAVANFITRHWQLDNFTGNKNGHLPTSQPIGKVEILTQKAKNHHTKDLLKVQVFQMVAAMSWPEQYDLALYYAPHLAGMRRSEVLDGLIGLKGIGTSESVRGGALWQGENARDFLENYANNPTVVMKIYVNKAVAMGILTKGNGGLYLNGATFVGKDVNDAVVHFSGDMQTYTNIIQPEVNKMELPDDDLPEEKFEPRKVSEFEKEEMGNKSREEWKAYYARLCRELDAWGYDVPYKIKTKELEMLHGAAKAKYEALLAETESVKLGKAVDPMASNDIEEIKAYMKKIGFPNYQAFRSVEVARAKVKEFLEKQEKKVAQAAASTAGVAG